MSINVLLADDHPVVRDGLKAVIDASGVDIVIAGEASNGHEVLKHAEKKEIDVYVLDISMPSLNGIETAKRLMKIDASCKIIILSIHGSKIFVEKAFKSGAKGYIIKESATREVVNAIHEVHKGKFFLSPSISKYIVDGFLGKSPTQNGNNIVELTEREREVLQLIAEGFTDKEISEKLHVSLNTAHVHRKNIMQKLDIHRNADLVRYAIREGISKL